jgi:hypothetical protein
VKLGSALPAWGIVPMCSSVIDQPEVIEVAERVAVTSSQLGLAWLLHREPSVLLTREPETPATLKRTWLVLKSASTTKVSLSSTASTSPPMPSATSSGSRRSKVFGGFQPRRPLRRYQSNLSGVMGKSRTRLPVALKTAFAIAAATPVIPISPTPCAPIGARGSGMSVQITSISGTSMWTGM